MTHECDGPTEGQTERRTDILIANAALHNTAQPKTAPLNNNNRLLYASPPRAMVAIVCRTGRSQAGKRDLVNRNIIARASPVVVNLNPTVSSAFIFMRCRARFTAAET